MKLAFVILIFVWTSSVLAVEKIHSFDSDIVIQSDGTINVTETIVINAEGNKIRRGIYRDFPTVYFGPLLTRSKVGFEVESITRDAYPEPYNIKSLSNGIRIYIGDENVRIPKGKQEYIIKYTTNRQIAFLEDFDEFYWNVTGNDWDFVIDQVNVSVTLPDGALESLLDVTGWTGYFGQEFKNLKHNASKNQLLFHSTQTLLPNQGMTIKIKITKGYIVDNENGVMNFFRDNFLWVLMLIALVSLLVFYYLSWDSYGRDPEAGILMPLFYPPKDLSPAAVRYIHKEKTDNKGFTAALISLAVKGVITIKQRGKKYTITRTENAAQKMDKLSKGERLIYKRLLARNKTFTISKTYSSKIGTASKKFNKLLKDEYKESCFKDNKRFGIVGILLSISILFIMYMHQSGGSVGFDAPKVGFFLITIIALVFIFKLVKGIADLGIVIFHGLIFAVGGFSSSDLLSKEIIILAIFLVIINAVFIYLLKSPTPYGRVILDKIAGFKLYLSTAEQDRLNILNPPELTPQLFERYLPFALALGVENQWSERFAKMLALTAKDQGENNYYPHWYSGDSMNFSSSNFSFSQMSSAMSSTVASASSPPSSSSGGGGFSGGGGGGGGGGGW